MNPRTTTYFSAPNTDQAIFIGIAHLLIANATYDRKFVEKYCNFRMDEPEPSLFFAS
ncbi:MAG: hypothetical protein P8N31_11560 [Planctomycetota bacterium]|nr:hypothetical protein [Planctomycetota bacterium]MDG2144185.1 hypothetical protein [Planctomycetota bacterium]